MILSYIHNKDKHIFVAKTNLKTQNMVSMIFMSRLNQTKFELHM
jgi:hypothetical protein